MMHFHWETFSLKVKINKYFINETNSVEREGKGEENDGKRDMKRKILRNKEKEERKDGNKHYIKKNVKTSMGQTIPRKGGGDF